MGDAFDVGLAIYNLGGALAVTMLIGVEFFGIPFISFFTQIPFNAFAGIIGSYCGVNTLLTSDMSSHEKILLYTPVAAASSAVFGTIIGGCQDYWQTRTQDQRDRILNATETVPIVLS